MSNSYQRIKDHISTNLKNRTEQLTEGEITEEIGNTRSLIEELGAETFAKVIGYKAGLDVLAFEEWERMERELEQHFNVRMKNGILILGAEQQHRDKTWWSNKAKIGGTNFYWVRYQKYIKTVLPPDVVSTIDKDTDLVMNNIGDPNLDLFDRKGMVVGHVQSGKTGNYAGLVCKAADAGYKFIVVIAGGINNLRNQTQHRLNEAFVGQDKGRQIGAGLGETPAELLPICLTTTERDFNKQDADRNSQGLNFDNIKVPILIVIKKNTHSLKNVISWLENQYRNKIADHAMLIIDDESDYASINTKESEDPTMINKSIRKLITLFRKGSYVAYTATPYANIFIDHEAIHDDWGDDLFPKDFIYALDAPSDYFGARKIFLDSEDRHLVPISEEDLNKLPLNHKKELVIDDLPESLYDAVRHFLINVAIRKLRGQGLKHNSMLIHASRFTLLHEKLSRSVEDYLNELKLDFAVYGGLKGAEAQSINIRKTRITLETRLPDRPSSENWEAVLQAISETIPTVIVREVHQRSKIDLEYRTDVVTNAIVVGGASLSRGFTLEGLSVSYFLRNTIFYDTLMQMGRWFGFRPGYVDICRVYMPEQTIDHFKGIIEATEDLIQDLKIMAENNRTPNEFGLAVRQHPDSALQVTARNKQKNVHEFYFSMRLDGQLKETAQLSADENDRKLNIQAIENILNALKDSAIEKVGNSFLWRNIEKTIVSNFLERFRVFSIDRLGITSRMPIEFVKKYSQDRETNWDVALYGGSGGPLQYGDILIKKASRKIEKKSGYFEVGNRQVSTGTAEAIALGADFDAADLDTRKKIREKLVRPLLMLHILETNDDGDFAAFGVSFPGSVLSNEETIKLKINTVYYNDLLRELEDEIDVE